MANIHKYRSIINQFIKYFGVALIGYVVDFSLLILLAEVFNAHYLIAASIGFVSGLIIVYILSNKFVFGESKIKSKSTEFILFASIGLIGLGLLNVLMWFFTDKLGIAYIVSKIAATVFVYVWNFFARRTLYEN